MYQIEFITVGKLKRGPHKTLVDEYVKRMGPYAKIDRTVIKEEPFRSETERSQVVEKEAQRIREKLTGNVFSVLLSEHGKTFTSIEFAKQMPHWSANGTRKLQFIVGGPLGVDPSLANATNLKLSLSPMTMPHDLAQVVLAEQLYRAMTILKGKAYHY